MNISSFLRGRWLNKFFITYILILILFTTGYSQSLKVVNWNLLNFPGTTGTARETYFRTVLNEINPDILVCQEMTSYSGVQQFLNNILNSTEPGKYATATFIDGPDSDNILFYKPTALQLVSQYQIPTDLRDISEYILQILSGTSAGTQFRIYSVHLKAGSATADKNQRYQEALTLRNYLNTLSANSLFIVCGDFNLQSSSESSFDILTGTQSDNDGRLKDPLNLVGTWYDNSAFAQYHTQSTRSTQFGGGASGGLDDRFDLFLTSYALDTDSSLRYKENSYLAYGNDGYHFNLSINDGVNYVVNSTIADSLYNASDHLPILIELVPQSLGTHSIVLSKKTFNFGAEQYGAVTPAGRTIISSTGTGTLNWTATKSSDWISVTPTSGNGPGALSIGIARTDLVAGTYQGTVTISDINATNSPQVININYHVYEQWMDAPPFGTFETPADGSIVFSSIPVTGWALDDIGMQSVKIYRGSGMDDRIYIGDAVFVEGARPDVEAAYLGYPQNSQAGWGYMLLTNFLPNRGNGAFTILAYAMDLTGHEVLLGSKKITCINASAILPFGAIDTPSQGGNTSGSLYYNFGWALTPPPNSIPTDGSTLTVWVDGIPLGHPAYGYYRADIADLFPGYLNANGAIGVYDLNTTMYSDGVHTIAWSVIDSGGNVDGIGSRYFSVQNVSSRPSMDYSETDNFAVIFEDTRSSIRIRRGFKKDSLLETILPGEDGIIRIDIPEVNRVEIYLNDKVDNENEQDAILQGMAIINKPSSKENIYKAYEFVYGHIRPLPIGSSFDSGDGVLYWHPGPGFLGNYELVFINTRDKIKKIVSINIVPFRYENKTL